MAKTHWKKLTNPDYLGAYSIDEGQDIILTIKAIREERITGADGKKEDCVIAYFVEPSKPMILNKTNMKTLEKLCKTPFIEDWAGRSIQIGVERVKAFGDVVDALRVRAFFPRVQSNQPILCADCGAILEGIPGKMNADQMAQYTLKKYGRILCGSCATKEAEVQKGNDVL